MYPSAATCSTKTCSWTACTDATRCSTWRASTRCACATRTRCSARTSTGPRPWSGPPPAAGVARVVFTSSAATIGEPRGVVGTEDTPHRGTFLSAYERSKFLAERRVLELGAELGVDVVCVNPSSVQGPGRTEGSARLLIELVNARLPVVVETFLSIVDVDDCTKGHLAAETRGRAGERYLLNGASLTTTRAIALVQAVAGRPRHVVRVPRAVAPAAGRCGRLGGPADAPGPAVLLGARADAAARAPLRRLPGHAGAGTRPIGRSRRPSLGPSPGTRSEG